MAHLDSFWRLAHLSDAPLLESLGGVLRNQRRALAELVAHLGDVEAQQQQQQQQQQPRLSLTPPPAPTPSVSLPTVAEPPPERLSSPSQRPRSRRRAQRPLAPTRRLPSHAASFAAERAYGREHIERSRRETQRFLRPREWEHYWLRAPTAATPLARLSAAIRAARIAASLLRQCDSDPPARHRLVPEAPVSVLRLRSGPPHPPGGERSCSPGLAV